MSTRCLVALARQSSDEFPCASNAIARDFYMDDLMTGGETQEECIHLYHEITEILNSSRLPLRKWCSNSALVLEHIGKDVRDPLFILEIGDEEMVKSLGLCWKPVLDEFTFNVTPMPVSSRLTKRALLSDLNKVFDPLGLVSPVLLKEKIFLQHIWAMKTDWDSLLSKDIQERWRSFVQDLELLQNVLVPRKALPEAGEEIQIHGFSDASQEVYGACIYVQSRSKGGRRHARLLCSKTRVAPLKSLTIPRLELSGALLLAELSARVADSWSLDATTFWCWTDSMMVLGWINCEGSRLKTYVANLDNPADLASRGLCARELVGSDKWWKGPSWLERECDWQPTSTYGIREGLPEQREIKLVLVSTDSGIDLINVISDWSRLLRSTAWLMLFVNYLRKKQGFQAPKYLTSTFLRAAETVLLKRVQTECFHKEFMALQKGKEVPRELPPGNASLRAASIIGTDKMTLLAFDRSGDGPGSSSKV
ncbi:Retrotransposon, Pao, partial [Cinara cedri]